MKGGVEMDAIVMDGRTLASGAVSAVRRVANPVQLARLVMDKVPHMLYVTKRVEIEAVTFIFLQIQVLVPIKSQS